MSARDTLVTCPCCQSRLEVDLRTGQVLKWNRPSEIDETGKPILREADWDEAAGKVKGRLSGSVDKFDANLSREKARSKDLDDLFAKAKEKVEKRKDRDELG